jgi:diaminohydroxyphosphoribosylaminopyrimidine deaminase/5-amino-6-(5-phosphoribosylamino)uracil reductase
VFDRRAMLNHSARLVATAADTPTWVVASPAAPAGSVAVLEAKGVRVLRPVDLAEGLAQVRAAGIESVLCEGGGALGARLLAEGLVDRLYWVQAPVWLGAEGVPAFPELPSVPIGQAPRWVPVERRTLGPDTLLVLDREPCSPGS